MRLSSSRSRSSRITHRRLPDLHVPRGSMRRLRSPMPRARTKRPVGSPWRNPDTARRFRSTPPSLARRRASIGSPQAAAPMPILLPCRADSPTPPEDRMTRPARPSGRRWRCGPGRARRKTPSQRSTRASARRRLTCLRRGRVPPRARSAGTRRSQLGARRRVLSLRSSRHATGSPARRRGRNCSGTSTL